MRTTTATLSLVALLAACRGDAPAGGSAQLPVGAPAKIEHVAHLSALAPHLRKAATPVKRPGAFGASIGEHANDPMRLGVDPAAWIAVELEGASAAKAEIVDGVRVHELAMPGADLLRLDEGDRVEDVILLRDAHASATHRWKITRGPGIVALRLREGFVEALDARGVSRLRADPLLAWDAAGTPVPVSTSLEGDVLVATVDHASRAHPVVLDPAWGPTTALAVARVSFPMLPLGGGRQMVLGGHSVLGTKTSTTEIYDPATGSWTLGKSLSSARSHLGGVVLKDGKLLVIGGRTVTNGATTSVVEVYDPVADTWTAKAPLPDAGGRAAFAYARYADDKVIVAGGLSGTTGIDTVLVYDVLANSWRTLGTKLQSVNVVFDGPLAVVLATGSVLFVEPWYNKASLFNPTLDTVVPVAQMPTFLYGASAIRLLDGKVMVVGQSSTTPVQIYDPGLDQWKTGNSAYGNGDGASLFLRPDARVMIAGGQIGKATAVYDAFADSWTALGTMVAERPCARGAVLPDGAILMVGGAESPSCYHEPTTGVLRTVELFGSGLATGAVCGAGGACASGSCVDGVCCNRACTGQCESCNAPGSIGTCKLLTGDPQLTRGLCAGSGACKGTCDGVSSGCIFPTTLCTPGNCTNGVETPAAQCDGAGSCPFVSSTVCSPYVCGAVSCKTSCTSDGDCAGERVCEAGKCVAKHDRGEACVGAASCAAPFSCVDSVCCDKPCDGPCESCSLTGSVGVCTPLDGALDDDGKCGTGPCLDVCKAGKCTYKTGAATCAAASCLDGVISTGGSCDGTAATCTGASSRIECSGLVKCADDKTCLPPKCGADLDCAGGRRCDLVTATCSLPPLADAGVSDTGVSETGSLDGGVGPSDAGTAESPAPNPGPKPAVSGEFTRCTKASECATGFCVEGVCCNTACTDKCSSCALLGSPGICTLEPVGVDLKSECGPALSCLGTCDGSGQCIGAGNGTMCGRNRCTTASAGVGPAYCAAAGAKCPTDDAVPFECSPYACETAFGACVTACKSSDDCARGFVCETTSRTCVSAAVAPAEEDSGCSLSRGAARSATASALLFGMIALGTLRRRRRA